MPASPPSPWDKFLDELGTLLDEPFDLHCIGGFVAVAAYGLARATNDLDYCSLIPCNRIGELQELAGEGSALAKKYKVHLHYVGVASLPESYEERVSELYPGRFNKIRLFVLDPYDFVLSKLSRNIERDREDVAYVAKKYSLDPMVLRERYTRELRAGIIGPVDQHDQALDFWIEAYFDNA